MLTFLRQPTYQTSKEQSIVYSLLFVVGMYVLQLMINLLLLLPFWLAGADEMLTTAFNDYESRLKSFRALYGPYNAILYATVLAPLVEETACRLCLYPKRVYVALSVATLTFVIPGIIGGTDYQDIPFHVRILLAVLLGLGSYRFLTDQLLQAAYHQYFPYLFYGLAGLFGILHLLNFQQAQWSLWPAYLTIILLLTISGVILGYTRLRLQYGYWWAVLLHGIINAKGPSAIVDFL